MAATPETSDYTSIQRRINSAMKGEQPPELLPFVGNERLNMPNGLMFSVKDYIYWLKIPVGLFEKINVAPLVQAARTY
jgi:hypothetical protein